MVVMHAIIGVHKIEHNAIGLPVRMSKIIENSKQLTNLCQIVVMSFLLLASVIEI